MAKITPDDNTEYFNTTLEEYNVTYSDGTFDYVIKRSL